jgi:hypothetical protein
MSISPITASNLVLYRPGVGSPISGGYAQLAAVVTAIDSTGLIATLRVMPSVGDPLTVTGVRHISVAAAGEQCWSHPATGLLTPTSTSLTVHDGAPATMPMPCTAGFCMVAGPSGTGMTAIAFWLNSSVTLAGGSTLACSFTGASPPYTLVVTSTGIASPVQIIVAIWPAGQ